jgi:cytochrome c oxidase subunit 2
MLAPHLVLIVLIALGIVWTAGWAMVVTHSGRAVPLEELEGSETRVRLWLLGGLAAVAIVLFILTLRWLPYEADRTNEIGSPALSVAVTGAQWTWTLSQSRFQTGVPIDFAVTSRDVNHDFAIYDPEGRLVAQVQAMPGYTNHLVYEFHEPGSYTIRCLEYCGLGHHTMTAPLTVVRK